MDLGRRLGARYGQRRSGGCLLWRLRRKHYQVANYPNVTIPTNPDVSEAASDKFGSFYARLFDRTLEKNPKAVVTEYAWDAGSCDPCPDPSLNGSDAQAIGSGRSTSGSR